MFQRELPGGFLLRPVEEADAAELVALVRANYEHLAPWMPWAKPDYSLDDALEFIKRAQSETSGGPQLKILGHDRIVGSVGMHDVNRESRCTSIGYWLTTDMQGRGIVTEAVRALLEHAFDDLGLNRVEIRAAVENARSRAIPERLGFTCEGTLRQSLWVRDRFVDDVVYSILAAEWPAVRARR